MRIGILSIGDEVVSGRIVDTNAAWLSKVLTAAGATVVSRRTVGDDRAFIATTIEAMADCCDVLVGTGGLGPTSDDLTREAVADVIDEGATIVDEEALATVEAWCRDRGLPMSEARQRVALRPVSATLVANNHGTAPGLCFAVGDTQGWMLPGPPIELKPMVTDVLIPSLTAQGVKSQSSAEVLVAGMSEVQVADCLGDLLKRDRRPQVGIRVGSGLVRLMVTDVDGLAGAVGVQATEVALRQHLGPWALPVGCVSLAQAVAEVLHDKCQTLVTAESCTGGGIGAALTEVAGSSAWFVGGWVTYTNALKTALLDVPEGLLGPDGPGAVSQDVVEAMAVGARTRSGADLAIAVSGIAGPDGGTPEKPVGTVWIAVADEAGVDARHMQYSGDRGVVRSATVRSALQLVRWRVCGVEERLWQQV